jgi:hypothetical protein
MPRIANANAVLGFGLFDDNSDGRLAVSNVGRPLAILEGNQAASYGFVQAVRADLDTMLDALDVSAGDSAGPERHLKAASIFAVYSPPMRGHDRTVLVRINQNS